MDLHLTAQHEDYNLEPLDTLKAQPSSQDLSNEHSEHESLPSSAAEPSPPYPNTNTNTPTVDTLRTIDPDTPHPPKPPSAETLEYEQIRRKAIREGKRRAPTPPAPSPIIHNLATPAPLQPAHTAPHAATLGRNPTTRTGRQPPPAGPIIRDFGAYDPSAPSKMMDPGSQASMVAEFNRLRAIRKGKEGKRVRFAPDSTAGQMTAGAPVVVRYTGGYAEVVDTIMVVRPLGGNEVQLATLLNSFVSTTYTHGDRGILHYSLMELRSETHEFHIRATYENHAAMDSHRRSPSYLKTIKQVEDEGLGVWKLRETRYWPWGNFTTCARVGCELFECIECGKKKEKTWMADTDAKGRKRGVKVK